MQVTILRQPTTIDNGHYYTLGRFFINNEYICMTLEPDDNRTPGTETYNKTKGKKHTYGTYNAQYKNMNGIHLYSAIPQGNSYTIGLKTIEGPYGFNQVGGAFKKYIAPDARDEVHRSGFNSSKEEQAWLNDIRYHTTGTYTKLTIPFIGNLPAGTSGILIHNGADWRNTMGCIVVGETLPTPSGKFEKKDIEIWKRIFDKLKAAVDKKEAIKLKITADDKELKKMAVNQEQQESSKPSRC